MAETVLNPRPHPRVLVCVSDSALATKLEFFSDYGGTLEFVGTCSEAYLGEYDLIVVDTALAFFNSDEWWERRLAVGPNVLYIQPVDGADQCPFDYLIEDEDDMPYSFLGERRAIPGKEVSMPDALPDELQRLIKSALVETVESRTSQIGIMPLDLYGNGLEFDTIQPFLRGPDGLILAGEYERSTGVHVWVLPADLPDFKPWVDVAFAEWSKQKATEFPSKPNWIKSTEWRTAEEAAAAEVLDELDRAFAERHRKYETERNVLLDNLAKAERTASKGERRLVFEQGKELENAVAAALETLGFTVQDMDETWPQDARREDFRVTRTEEPEWLSIVEVTGTTRGVKDEKINSLRDHAEDYMADEKPDSPPSKWLIVNRELKKDPNSRGSFVRSDRLRTTAKNGVLVLDSVALFKLVRFVQTHSDRAEQVRDYLRHASGGIEQKDARAWIAEQSSTDSAGHGEPEAM